MTELTSAAGGVRTLAAVPLFNSARINTIHIRMSRKLLTLLLTACTLGLTAQEVLTTNYFPQAGDTLRTNIADSAWAASLDLQLPGGTDLSWDLSAPVSVLELSRPVTTVADSSAFPEADFVIVDDFLNARYLQQEGDELLLVGIDSRFNVFPDIAVSTPVAPARPERRIGLTLGDTFTTTVSNVNVISPDTLPAEALTLLPADIAQSIDSIRVTATAMRTDVVDAYGTVQLGDNFYSTIREKRTEAINITVEVLFPIPGFGWQDVTGAVASNEGFDNLVGDQPVATTYLWWSDESKEPIVELATSAEDSILYLQYKRALQPTSTDGPGLLQATAMIYPNPADAFVNFSVEGLATGKYELTLTNMIGRRVLQQSFSAFGDQSQVLMDVTNYPSGIYVVNLRNQAGHSLVSRRLMVR